MTGPDTGPFVLIFDFYILKSSGFVHCLEAVMFCFSSLFVSLFLSFRFVARFSSFRLPSPVAYHLSMEWWYSVC